MKKKSDSVPSSSVSGLRRRRHLVQALGALVVNGNFQGFVRGSIYTGDLKAVCVPVLNCYSCPGALGACPIGSLQAVANSGRFNLSFYVVGLLTLFGMTLGRWFCGWLCPFGWIQEILHRISFFRIRVPKRLHNVLTKLKFVLLAVFVFALPLLFRDSYGLSSPAFCKWICPVGALEAGIPLVAMNAPLQDSIGTLFSWKLFLLLVTVIGSMGIYRFFCKYACPLGAFYGLFNPVSTYRMTVSERCIRCNRCTGVCRMEIEPYKTPNSAECIRCGDCVKVCPTGALHQGFCHAGFCRTKENKTAM
ncbi:MAG: 4Fe-4S binding protein [Ndongobacter sp.]|nr:4Fe-4S binding protein [Ndongobacter sp.]